MLFRVYVVCQIENKIACLYFSFLFSSMKEDDLPILIALAHAANISASSSFLKVCLALYILLNTNIVGLDQAVGNLFSNL